MVKVCQVMIILAITNSRIEDMIKKCPCWLAFKNCQPTEPIINHLVPNQTWTKIVAGLSCMCNIIYW